jgi:hypothetical protein
MEHERQCELERPGRELLERALAERGGEVVVLQNKKRSKVSTTHKNKKKYKK